MKQEYKKLQIDTELLDEWLMIDAEEYLGVSINMEKKDSKERIKYDLYNDKVTVKIDFIKNKGGLLTIYPDVGKQQEISNKIAEKIYKRAKNPLKDSPFMNGFSMPMDKEDFEALKDLIAESDGVELKNYSRFDTPGNAVYDQYSFTGPLGDTIVLKYFDNTARMQMQGKPLQLFSNVILLLGDKINNKNELVDAQLKYCKIQLKSEDVNEELKTVIGEQLYAFLPHTHKAFLSSSLVFSKIDVPLEDYSILVMPVAKAFEGFAKKIFQQYGLNCKSIEQLGQFFTWIDSNGIQSPVMKDEFACNLDKDIIDGLTSLFSFYSKVRHPYMHSGDRVFNTNIIENRETAEDKCIEMITAMKNWLQWLYQRIH